VLTSIRESNSSNQTAEHYHLRVPHCRSVSCITVTLFGGSVNQLVYVSIS
jgi:hypothetical protein